MTLSRVYLYDRQPAVRGEREVSEALNAFVIHYADVDRRPEHFAGHGAEEAARKRFEQLAMSWTCRLYECIAATGYEPVERTTQGRTG
jgi:hypothetical protein